MIVHMVGLEKISRVAKFTKRAEGGGVRRRAGRGRRRELKACRLDFIIKERGKVLS